jgi:hypothetical protein
MLPGHCLAVWDYCFSTVNCINKLITVYKEYSLYYVHVPVKMKGKAASVHAIKVYRGSGGMAPFILNPDTRWR